MSSPKKSAPKAAAKKAAPKKSAPARSTAAEKKQPSRANVARAAVDDAMTPLTQGDALELFASQVVEEVAANDPNLVKKFDPYWFRIVIDLASQVVDKCQERDVVSTLSAIQKERGRGGRLLAFRERALRRKIARNLPSEAKSQLDGRERDELVGYVIQAGIAAKDDPDMWDAGWGRATGWTAMVQEEQPWMAGQDPAAEAIQQADEAGWAAEGEPAPIGEDNRDTGAPV